MIYAHLEVPGNVPWVDEFFGHPGEYWPVYLFISALVCAVAYLFVEVRYLNNARRDLSVITNRTVDNLTETLDLIIKHLKEDHSGTAANARDHQHPSPDNRIRRH